MSAKGGSHFGGALLLGVEVAGAPVDVRVADEAVLEVAAELSPHPGEAVLQGRGGALLAGLNDHHAHLFGLAAALSSVACGPPHVRSEAALVCTLRAAGAGAPASGVRGVGYHESVAGSLDRWTLDAWLPGVSVRIQHRSGALWVLNSRALAELGTDCAPEGAERDARGRLTGRFLRLDRWLRERMPKRGVPDLRSVGALLARAGVTGVTDAGAENGPEELALFERAIAAGELPQRVLLMGRTDLPPAAVGPRLARGPLKILLDEWQPLATDALTQRVAGAHAAGRRVAFHCVTRTDLFLAITALEGAGARRGDRIEHASIAPPEAIPRLAQLGVTVVTQPGFVRERGDDYLREVAAHDQAWLYRLRSFDAAGIPLAAGTDAPFGSPDPWLAMRAAVHRQTEIGATLGATEALSPERALALFTTALGDPGGRPSTISPGAPADLCLLRVPWREAREQLSKDLVAATLIGGRVIWRAPELSG